MLVMSKDDENDADAFNVVADDWKEAVDDDDSPVFIVGIIMKLLQAGRVLAPFIIIELLLFPVFIDGIVRDICMVVSMGVYHIVAAMYHITHHIPRLHDVVVC